MKILITGDTYAVKTDIKEKDFLAVCDSEKKYIIEDASGKQCYCFIYDVCGKYANALGGNIGMFGMVFNNVSDDGYLMVTESIAPNIEDKKEYIALMMAKADRPYKQACEEIQNKAEELWTQKNNIFDCIELL